MIQKAKIGALSGILTSVLMLIIVNIACLLWRAEDGTGDAWLLGVAGYWEWWDIGDGRILAWPCIYDDFVFSRITYGAIAGLILIVLGKRCTQDALPYGLFVSIAFIFLPIFNILAVLY